jgi:MarR family 2-MHQ and catechol resistance regulon transcriptional repressor
MNDRRVILATLIGRIAAGEPDLTDRQLALLMIAATQGRHTVARLSHRICVSKPVITRAMDALIELGFLKRVRCTEDRRIVFAVATEAGRNFLEQRFGGEAGRLAA